MILQALNSMDGGVNASLITATLAFLSFLLSFSAAAAAAVVFAFLGLLLVNPNNLEMKDSLFLVVVAVAAVLFSVFMRSTIIKDVLDNRLEVDSHAFARSNRLLVASDDWRLLRVQAPSEEQLPSEVEEDRIDVLTFRINLH